MMRTIRLYAVCTPGGVCIAVSSSTKPFSAKIFRGLLLGCPLVSVNFSTFDQEVDQGRGPTMQVLSVEKLAVPSCPQELRIIPGPGPGKILRPLPVDWECKDISESGPPSPRTKHRVGDF